jgi:hypothetical protein
MKKLILTISTFSLLAFSASSFGLAGDTSKQYEIDNQLQQLNDFKRIPSNNIEQEKAKVESTVKVEEYSD